MAKKQTLTAGDTALEIRSDDRRWAQSAGTYIAGRAYLDEADHTAAQMEAKWGADRLRLVVTPDLREKFDRQRYLLNQAIWGGELEDVRREAQRMVRAYLALDGAAARSGAEPLPPMCWEIALEDGTVAAIVPDNARAHLVKAEGRAISIYTLEEIARLLAGFPSLVKAKLSFPGAEVVAVRRSISDPLLSVHDTDGPLDEVAEGEFA
jgi:hypothetical protein